MKRLILTIMIFWLAFLIGLLVSTCFAGEIIPTNPLIITQPAVRVIDYSIEFYPDKIAVKFNYQDAGNNIVKEKWVTIEGSDFVTLMNATIQTTHVGQKFSDVMFKAIRNKCKTILAIEGVVN